MRIAVLAHVRQPIARPFAGGMEAHAWHLTAGLIARGHDVTLFASGDSDPRFPVDPVLPVHYEASFPGAEHRGHAPLIEAVDAGHAAACERIAAGGFDVLHNNGLHRFPLDRRRTGGVPTVTSLHVPPFDALAWFVHASIAPGHRLTATSARHLAAWWPEGAPASATVLPNGIDVAAWPVGCGEAGGAGGAVWCGRMLPNKAPHLAARAALAAGVPLTLAGAIEDEAYWRDAVVPLLGEGVRYAGHLDRPALAALMGGAAVFVFTPAWDEPFGLAAVEAMACGLPVAAFDRGAAREVIGEAGRFAAAGDVAGLAAAIRDAAAVPRDVPRARVERLYGLDRWLDGCEAAYRTAIDDAAVRP